MPSVAIAGAGPTLVFSSTALPSILQNTGQNTIYIDTTPNVQASPNYNFIAPNVSFRWPAREDLFAVCAPGTSSMLAYISNGAEIGVASTTQALTAPQYLPAPLPNSLYISQYPQQVGIYTITCPITTVATLLFFDINSNLITTAVTVAGTVTVNVPVAANYISYYTDAGTNVTITIQLTGTHLPYNAGVFTFGISSWGGDNGFS